MTSPEHPQENNVNLQQYSSDGPASHDVTPAENYTDYQNWEYGDDYAAEQPGATYSNQAYGDRGYYDYPEQYQELPEEEVLPPADELGFFSYRSDTPARKTLANKDAKKKAIVKKQEEGIIPVQWFKKIFHNFTHGIGGVLTSAVLIAVVVALFIWPGFLRAKELDENRTNQEVKSTIEQVFGWSDIDSVSCHTRGVTIRAGKSFTCHVTSDRNVNVTLSAVFKDSSGNYVIQKPEFNS